MTGNWQRGTLATSARWQCSWRRTIVLLALGLGVVLCARPALAAPDGPTNPTLPSGPAITAPPAAGKPGQLPGAAQQPAGTAATTQATPPQTVINQTTVDFRWTDAASWANTVFAQVLVTALGQVAAAVRGVVDGVLASPANFLTQTPPSLSYNNDAVRTAWGDLRAVADAALVLVAVWGGFTVMARDKLHAPFHEALALVPRLVVGVVLIHTSLLLGQLAIDLGNGLCGVLGRPSLPGWGQAATPSQALAEVLAVAVYTIAALVLVLQMLLRLALLDVLLVVSPLALACWVLPQTAGWFRRWAELFVGAVVTQVLQTAALALGSALVGSLATAGLGGGLVDLCLGLAVLCLTLKLPGLLGGLPGSGWGGVLRVVELAGGVAAARGAVGAIAGKHAARPVKGAI